jgi:hypothetical protein
MVEVERILIVGGGFWGEEGPCLGISRCRLQRVLLSAAAPVPHRLGVGVTGLDQGDEGASRPADRLVRRAG